MILDPDNPANIILFLRKNPADTLSLPGGYIVHMIEPFENAIKLLNYKIGVKDSDDPMPLGMGTAGIPRMEDMFIDGRNNVGPVLGMVGFKDRVEGQHVINFAYHMVTKSGITPKLVSADQNVLKVISCKMVNLLVKGLDTLMPGESKNGHFFTQIAIPADDQLGDEVLPLHLDHLKLIFKLFQKLILRGLLTQEGELSSNYEDLKYLYQIMEKADEEDQDDVSEQSEDKNRINFV